MIIDRLNSIYEWINKLNPHIKTMVIIVLGVLILQYSYTQSLKDIAKITTEVVEEDKTRAEKYTISIAPEINNYVQDILEHDPKATNVILLNYHNSVSSTNGLSYRYLTALTEKKRGFETRTCIKIWTELAYINYEDELSKINTNGYLELNQISDGYVNFPKLSELLIACNAKSACLYPLIGIEGNIGLIVIIYDSPVRHSKDYYQIALAPYTQPLTVLLDYNTVKKKYQ